MANEAGIVVKEEPINLIHISELGTKTGLVQSTTVIELSSSESESNLCSTGTEDDGGAVDCTSKRTRETVGVDNNGKKKRRKEDELGITLPSGFLDPLPLKQLTLTSSSPLSVKPQLALPPANMQQGLALLPTQSNSIVEVSNKQFWKAGDYEGDPGTHWSYNGGMDHVRVHPRFLHSNATSHKWVLGAFAELLDNALDEVSNGATCVTVDMVKNKKDGCKMLLIEDNGGGMNPNKMRECMSLGYSAKSKMADTIGQYGNGFKTSTMRLGADVIVFSRCSGKGGERPTQSIGLLSYTFLRQTGKEDIVVPMLDYEKREDVWTRVAKSTISDWNANVDTIIQWSPFSSEADLLQQFDQIKDQGTRIIIYNLWEDDQGMLELDFDTDPHDIQIRGVNRDEKSIEKAQMYPNSRHFLTYRHSLRNYAAILYLRLPSAFRIILRGKDVEHHNIVNDMMMSQEITYRPQPSTDGIPKNSNLVAVVTVGFVKDAKAHIDVQGFNVYHKNRLIKPFWRVWHPPGSDGRGVIGVLEANFVEPAHDKQGFERTTVLSRLEQRLIQMQKTYWSSNCHKIGYAPRRSKMMQDKEPVLDSSTKTPRANKRSTKHVDVSVNIGNKGRKDGAEVMRTHKKQPSPTELSSDDSSDNNDRQNHTSRDQVNGSSSPNMLGKDGSKKSFGSVQREVSKHSSPMERPAQVTTRRSNLQKNGFSLNDSSQMNSDSNVIARLEEENHELRERLKKREEEILGDLLCELQSEKARCKSLEAELQVAERKNEELMKEQESLIEIFSEERQRRDTEEECLRQKIKVASSTMEELLEKVRWLERKQPKLS